MKHQENLAVAIAGIWLDLLTLLGFRLDVVNAAVSTGFFMFWTRRAFIILLYLRLFNRLTALIAEDPPMNREDLDAWITIISTGLIWLGGFLKLFFGL